MSNPTNTADITAILKARQTTMPLVVAAGVMQATPAAISDDALSAFLVTNLPQIQAKTLDIAHGFTLPKLFDLATVVSMAVRDGLPLAKGQDAAHIVQVVTGYAFDHYLVPALPANYQMFAGLLRPMLLQGIEAVYQLVVKPKVATITAQ